MASCSNNKDSSKNKKHAHGPLQRSGDQAKRWGDAIGKSIEILPAAQLPKTRTILQRYHFIRINQPQLETNAVSRTIAGECVHVWNRARVPTKSFDDCIKKVKDTIDNWLKINRAQRKCMQLQYQAKLEELFDLAPKPPGRGGNVEKENEFLRKLMSSVGKPKTTGFKHQDSNDGDSFEDDLKFYLDQKGPRMQQLLMLKLTCKENAKIRTKLKRKHVPQDDAETSEEVKTSTSEEGEWSQEEDTSDETFNHTPTSKPSDLVNLSFSKKSLLRNSTEEALRLGLSHREHVMMTAKFVKMGGGSLKDVALSVTTSHRHRKNVLTSKT